MKLSELVKWLVTGLSCIKLLKLSDDGKIDINETKEKNIDLVELALLNLELLKEK